jgi:dihydroorotase
LVEGLRERARRDGIVRVGVIGAMTKGTGRQRTGGDRRYEAGRRCGDFGRRASCDPRNLFLSGLEYAAMFDCLVITHAEDEGSGVRRLYARRRCFGDAGNPGRPSVAEDIAISRDIMLAEYAGAPLHIAHVSSKGAVEIIRAAKRRGVKVTAEATPHHLVLDR